tara:strand:- start:672 stop:950 length:279 start_codon:yes stop_codon:yes gene_type:complete
MNGRKAKVIRAHVETLTIAWLKGLMSDAESEKINKDTYKAMLPKKPYIYLKQAVRLNAFHPRWVAKKIKKILKRHPLTDIQSITVGDIDETR